MMHSEKADGLYTEYRVCSYSDTFVMDKSSGPKAIGSRSSIVLSRQEPSGLVRNTLQSVPNCNDKRNICKLQVKLYGFKIFF